MAQVNMLANMSFPPKHWARIYSTHPTLFLGKELRRRSYMVCILPDEATATHLVGSVVMETSGECRACHNAAQHLRSWLRIPKMRHSVS